MTGAADFAELATALEPAVLLSALAGAGALVTGGIYAAFPVMVLPALDRLERLGPGRAAEAMRSINDAAERPPFLLLFFGSAVVAAGTAVLAGQLPRPSQVWAGVGLSLAAFALTLAVNVPLNRKLAAGTLDASWSVYRRQWGAANSARALASVAGGVLLLTAR
ncbi:putative membrane protein [Arthrobacter sp. UYP6]|uniref:anthrone oxygenase family protein n=1 Tax=Arthrobacter sp. UYP6 TaxID=1756378 RepID=UPI00339A88E8